MALHFKEFVPGKHWDSELIVPRHVANAILRLTVRLKLEPYAEESLELSKRDENGVVVPDAKTEIDTRPWKHSELVLFRQRVKSLCQQHWNGEFWLEPPSDCTTLDVPYSPLNVLMPGILRTTPTHRPNIKCELQIQLVPEDSAAEPHRTVTVLRLDDGQAGIRQSAKLWDHLAVDRRKVYRSGQAHWQLPVVHEFGHLLELHHPLVGKDPDCTELKNSSPRCYCVNGWCGELMGSGMAMTDRLAAPWQTSMEKHTGIAATRWGVLRVQRLPKLIALIDNPVKAKVNFGFAGPAFGV